MNRIVIVTPVFPEPETGADQYERAGNMRQLVRLGYDVTVIAKVRSSADQSAIADAARMMGVRLITVPYRYDHRNQSAAHWLMSLLGRLIRPQYLDGAAYEYTDPRIQEVLADELRRERPVLVWFDYSYLWPLYHLVKKQGIPIVTRPINFEPRHLIEEEGHSLTSYVKYIAKCVSEYIVARQSDVIAALSPQEARIYQRLGAKKVVVLPLRGLPQVMRQHHTTRAERPLHVCFMGSTYSVGHNERALDLVTRVLAPRAAKEAPGEFIFHISGARVPPQYLSRFNDSTVIFEGYVDHKNFDAYMDRMDIALSPSPKRVGMQQKVYEPLCRGIPLIAPRVATGGYPLTNGTHYLAAETPDEYFEALLTLREAALRERLSKHAIDASKQLFSAPASDEALKRVLSQIGLT